MSILPSGVLDTALKRRDELLTVAETLVTYDTPSGDKVRCDALADELAARYAPLGTVERMNNPQGGDHLRIRVAAPGATSEVKPALILCHYDTVWSAGTVAHRPMYVEDDRAFGPGLYDMKISLAMAELGLQSIKEHAWHLARPVILLLTSDEEIGSPTSRALIETTARECNHVLVLEPPVEPHGELKTARKGIGMFNVTITGKAAHAGVEPEKGASAISELAYEILAIHALADHAAGTTTNVGIVKGGTRRNVVPAEARMEVDARVWTSAEARRLEEAFQNLRPVTPGVQVEATGSFSRPPMERTPASRHLFAEARRLGAALGLNLGEGATGGGSDGNFTAALGIATLDGLGSPGEGAHAEHEQISISGALERMALLIMLLTHI